MSSYTHIDHTGVLDIASLRSIGRTKIITTQGETKARIHIDNSDAPTVALELLKAAGQESVIVPLSEVPTYKVRGNYLHFLRPDGKEHAIGTYESPEQLRREAQYNLITAEYIESTSVREAAEKAEAEAAEKKLQERRDAIAKEIVGPTFDSTWVDASAPIQRAIDRIIELEDAAAK